MDTVDELVARVKALPGKKNRKARDRAKKLLAALREKVRVEAAADDRRLNFVQAACPGCHVARSDAAGLCGGGDSGDGACGGGEGGGGSGGGKGGALGGDRDDSANEEEDMGESWFVGVDDFDPEDFGLREGDDVPDISLDPETQLLTAFNPTDGTRTIYVTVGHPARDAHGREMTMGVARDEAGNERPCLTLVLVLEPRSVMDVCYVDLTGAALPPDIQSDIKDLPLHPDPDAFDERLTFQFPLGGDGEEGPFQCTQGMGGCFTHFFPGTFHAVDLGCPVGTPVLAVADGVVTDIQQCNEVGGIHVRNLFLWNSVTLKVKLPAKLPSTGSKREGGAAAGSAARGDGAYGVEEGGAAGSSDTGEEGKEGKIMGNVGTEGHQNVDSGETASVLACAAVGNGNVKDVAGGDSIDGPDFAYIEYVHIQSDSVVVEVGQTVAAGDVLCRSGDVGFCPCPHLHIQAHTSDAKNAPTVKLGFSAEDGGSAYFPSAGCWYVTYMFCRFMCIGARGSRFALAR